MLKNLLGNKAGEFKPGCLMAKLVPVPTMVCHLPWQKEGSTHLTEQPHRTEGAGPQEASPGKPISVSFQSNDSHS